MVSLRPTNVLLLGPIIHTPYITKWKVRSQIMLFPSSNAMACTQGGFRMRGLPEAAPDKRVLFHLVTHLTDPNLVPVTSLLGTYTLRHYWWTPPEPLGLPGWPHQRTEACIVFLASSDRGFHSLFCLVHPPSHSNLAHLVSLLSKQMEGGMNHITP